MSNPVIDEYGNQCWHNSDGELHREDGPAVIYVDGSQEWWINGKCGRMGEPAFISCTGAREWVLNDALHRTDGPAYISADGSQRWYVNSKRMRSNKEFQKEAALSDEDMTTLILKYGNIE